MMSERESIVVAVCDSNRYASGSGDAQYKSAEMVDVAMDNVIASPP